MAQDEVRIGDEAVLAAVIRSSLDCIIVADEAGRVVEFNPAAEATFGHARADVLGRPLGDVIVPMHHRQAHADGFARYLAGGEARVLGRRIQIEALRANGEIFPVELSITEARVEGRRMFTASLRDLSERLAAENALRTSEARLAAFMQHAPATMFLKDADGRYLLANQHAADRLGRPLDEIIGRTLGEVSDEPDLLRHTANAEREVLSAGRPSVTVQSFDLATGRVHGLATRFPVPDAEGRFTQLGGVFIDITAQREAELRLKESETSLRLAVEGAQMGTWSFDPRTQKGQSSAKTREIMGLHPDREISQAERLACIHPDDRAAMTAAVEAAFRGGDEISSEYRIVRGDGEVRWVLSRGLVQRDDRGRPVGATGILIDITDRKHAEEQLRESERRFRALSDFHPVPVTFVRVRDEQIVLANPAFHEMMRLPAEAADQLNRRSWYASRAERDRIINLCRAERRVDGVETEMRRYDGSAFWAALSWRWIELDGEPVVVSSFIDLTDRKRAEAELERSREALHQSEKLTALGSLLAGVSHELNNPLAVVVGESIILEEDAEGTPLADGAGRIRRAAERCARIVQTFLAMARQRKPERKPVDANEVVHAALELAEYGLRTAGVQVVTELAPSLPPLWADSDQIHQVVMNLLINAQQALQEVSTERRLRIRTERGASGRVAIEVADNGPGVPPEIAKRIFEPFFTTKPTGAGTGVGLSFSHGIAEAHGGALQLRPSPDGAVFRLELPVAVTAELGPNAPAIDDAAAAKAGRILVVDDEPELAATLGRFLERDGFVVELAGSRAEATARLATGRFQAILSDLRMPDVDGPALFTWIQAHRPELADRIGFVTGDTLGPAAARFLAAARRPVLEKPFTRDALRDLVEQLLARAPVA